MVVPGVIDPSLIPEGATQFVSSPDYQGFRNVETNTVYTTWTRAGGVDPGLLATMSRFQVSTSGLGKVAVLGAFAAVAVGALVAFARRLA